MIRSDVSTMTTGSGTALSTRGVDHARRASRNRANKPCEQTVRTIVATHRAEAQRRAVKCCEQCKPALAPSAAANTRPRQLSPVLALTTHSPSASFSFEAVTL